jgi:hypothetical protein
MAEQHTQGDGRQYLEVQMMINFTLSYVSFHVIDITRNL